MAKVLTEQKTKSYRWRKFRGPIVAGSEDANLVLSHVLSGGAYARRRALGAQDLNKLFRPEGGPPNVGTICPVIAMVSTLTSTFRFKVGVFKGVGNSMDRICYVSAKAGGYRTSCIAPRPGGGANDTEAILPADDAGTSAYYCHQLACVDDYGNTVDKIDADSANGKGYIAFDLNGVTDLIINTHSTLPTSSRVYFEVGGLY